LLYLRYISGAGTDSSEKRRLMWARVKGKTENDLMKLRFSRVYAFRPGFIQPTPGLQNTLRLYHYIGWLIPVLRTFFGNSICSLRNIGQAMISVTMARPQQHVLEVKDIIAATERQP
jgi:hypothetical protein